MNCRRFVFVTLWVAAVLMVVLVVTGLILTFRYRPSVSSAYANVQSLESSTTGVEFLRSLHRGASWLLIGDGIALLIGVIRLAGLPRLRAVVALPALTVVALIAAAFTGHLLPWDQLSLWAVTVGTNIRGYSPAFGSNVKFVLVGSSEVSPGTFKTAFWVHTVVLSLVVIGLFAATWYATHRLSNASRSAELSK